MAGIASAFVVSTTSTTVAAAGISTTTAATSVTILYVNKPHVVLEFENTTGTDVNIARLPVTIAGDGTTTTGTAAYWRTIPGNSYRVVDIKANGVMLGPAVYKVFADSTPASGLLNMIVWPNK
jgi:hypothetical protein